MCAKLKIAPSRDSDCKILDECKEAELFSLGWEWGRREGGFAVGLSAYLFCLLSHPVCQGGTY